MLRTKKILQWFPVLLLVMTLPVGVVLADVELVVNGGFETGDLTGWTPFGPVFDGGVTNVDAHTGTYSLELGSLDFIEQVFSPDASTTSDLTFWARAPGFSNVAYITIDYSDSTTDQLQFSPLPNILWNMFTLPVDNTKLASRIYFSTGETDTIFVDDISLSGPDPPVITSEPVTSEPDPSGIPLFGLSLQIIVAISLIAVTGYITLKRSQRDS